MRSLVDENVSRRLPELLGSYGHDAVHFTDTGLRSASDDEVLLGCAPPTRPPPPRAQPTRHHVAHSSATRFDNPAGSVCVASGSSRASGWARCWDEPRDLPGVHVSHTFPAPLGRGTDPRVVGNTALTQAVHLGAAQFDPGALSDIDAAGPAGNSPFVTHRAGLQHALLRAQSEWLRNLLDQALAASGRSTSAYLPTVK